MKDQKRFYTYAYLRKNGTPYYVGKGEKSRAYNKNHNNVYVPPKNRILFLKKKLTEEHKKKLTESHIGIKKGTCSQKTKDKISRAHKDKKHYPPSQKGTKWWNNGQINKRNVECPGEEWCLGKLLNVN